MYRAVLDTCALVPGLQRHFLLQVETEEAYAPPLWGSGTLLELDYVLARLDAKRGRADSAEHRRHLLEQILHAFPGAEVHAPKDREYDYGLDDPDDGHVAHAAILGKADAIVTDDTPAGFRTSAALQEAAVDVVYPAEFTANTVPAHPEAGVQALAARMTDPARTPHEVLAELHARYGMDEVAAILAPFVSAG